MKRGTPSHQHTAEGCAHGSGCEEKYLPRTAEKRLRRHRRPVQHHGGGDRGDEAGRHHALERSGRSGGKRKCDPRSKKAAWTAEFRCSESASVISLQLWLPAAGTRKDEIRTPGSKFSRPSRSVQTTGFSSPVRITATASSAKVCRILPK